MKKKNKTMRTALVLGIMVITVWLLYYHMVNKVRSAQPEVTVSVAQNLALRNLETNYPTTPREVMKYYNEIQECFYNQEYTEEEFEALAEKVFYMYDEELAANQDKNSYVATLKSEIQKYREADTVISSSALASSTDVDYYTHEGKQCANIRCVYTIREKTALSVAKEVYVLRKDDNGHWKIFGWKNYVDEAFEN